MSNLDEIFSKAKGFVNIAGKKTGDILEISKLKIEKINKKSELQSKYESLGKTCYREYKETLQETNKISQIINEIDVLEAQIKEIDSYISEMKNDRICSHCGNKNNKKFLYCSSCGSPLYPRSSTQRESTDYIVPNQNITVDMTEEQIPDSADINPSNPESENNNMANI